MTARPLLFERITCTVLHNGLQREFLNSTESSAEQQWDKFLGNLRLRGGVWTWRVLCHIALSEGPDLLVEIKVGRRFSSGRQCIAETLIERAQDSPRQMREETELASRLLGRPLTLNETPQSMRPTRRYPSASSMSWPYLPTATQSRARASWCTCNQQVPRMRAYQDSRPVEVFALHTLRDTNTLCPDVVRVLALIDPRQPSPLSERTPSLPALEQRTAWLQRQLAAIPVELGGPQDAQTESVLNAMDQGLSS